MGIESGHTPPVEPDDTEYIPEDPSTHGSEEGSREIFDTEDSNDGPKNLGDPADHGFVPEDPTSWAY